MRKVLYLITATALLVFLVSCQQNVQEELPQNQEAETTVRVYLTDRPVSDVERIYVDIENVSYKYETSDGATVVETGVSMKNVDLLSLAGTEIDFFDMDVPEGATLVYIELEVPDATVVVNGEEHDVLVVKGSVRIMVNEKIEEGDEIVLDFDTMQSLKVRGNPVAAESSVYILTPVIGHTKRNRHKGDVHKIHGYVKDSSGEPLEGVVVALLPTDESTVLRSTVSCFSGRFVIGGVRDGSYRLNFYILENPLDESIGLLDLTPATSIDVTVSGEDVVVGEIVME